MTVAVQMPAQKESDLEQVMKIVAIAQGALGLGKGLKDMMTHDTSKEDATKLSWQKEYQLAPEAQAEKGLFVPKGIETPEGMGWIQRPKEIAQMTPYQKEMLRLKEKELASNASKTESGTKLKPTDIDRFSQGRSAIKQIDQLSETLIDNKSNIGPVTGRLYGMNPYATDTQTVQAAINTAKQTIGKYLEGGVLRKEDEVKYEKILPKLSDTPEVAQNKLSMVKQLLMTKLKDDVNALKLQGYDISGIDIPELSVAQKPLNTSPTSTIGKATATPKVEAEPPISREEAIRELQRRGVMK